MIGEKRFIITGVEWQILSEAERQKYTNRLAKVGLENKDVQYLDVDGGDVTAYAYHYTDGKAHAKGHCQGEAWAFGEMGGNGYKCSCGVVFVTAENNHEACLIPVVI